ncbi:DUF6126 family protein [Streptomyces marincola]|uniref:Small hydrophobic protein n=1 Tax=Streptomyces marincola TaxID=2878388 RepID=A0A1W7D513_9ACTN|nr:DUF6126 family protein [Streptomyces marincola]ARP51729.1 small hydrophobic protein [Streptomyces marincola]ARQ72009.1 small hydrophobic protein [Streptomyces marincola]
MQEERKAAKDTRDRIPHGLWIRMLIYGLVGHLFAAFLVFLFSLGA